MDTTVQRGPAPRRQMAARAVLVWALLAVSTAAGGGPEGLRLLLAAPFALLGVGFAALISLRGMSGLPGYALVLVGGLSSLILISAGLVYSGLGGSHLGLMTVGLQGSLAFLLVSAEARGRGGQPHAVS